MRYLLAILVLVAIPATSISAEDPKFSAAIELHNAFLDIDRQQTVVAVTRAILSQLGENLPPELVNVINSFLLELIESEEYAEAKARVYSSLFSLEEIVALTELVQTPEYRVLSAALPDIATASRLELNRLMQVKRPELDARMQRVIEQLGAR